MPKANYNPAVAAVAVKVTLTYHLGGAHDVIRGLLESEPEAAGAPQAKLALAKIMEAAEIMGVDLNEHDG